MVNAQRGQRKKPQFEFEYVTRTVSLLKQASHGDGIAAHVINDSGLPESTRVHVYQNTGQEQRQLPIVAALLSLQHGSGAYPLPSLTLASTGSAFGRPQSVASLRWRLSVCRGPCAFQW